MTVLQLKEILSAELLCGGDHLDREVGRTWKKRSTPPAAAT